MSCSVSTACFVYRELDRIGDILVRCAARAFIGMYKTTTQVYIMLKADHLVKSLLHSVIPYSDLRFKYACLLLLLIITIIIVTPTLCF